MDTVSALIVAAALVFSSLLAPDAAATTDHDTSNKSPCFQEEVYECQASGGTFNWSHCTCSYN